MDGFIKSRLHLQLVINQNINGNLQESRPRYYESECLNYYVDPLAERSIDVLGCCKCDG